MSEEPTKLLFELVGWGKIDDDNEECRRLVLSGADIHDENEIGSTPLIYAAFYNKSRILSCLVGLGASLNHTDNNGSTAAMWAASNGNDDWNTKAIHGSWKISHFDNVNELKGSTCDKVDEAVNC